MLVSLSYDPVITCKTTDMPETAETGHVILAERLNTLDVLFAKSTKAVLVKKMHALVHRLVPKQSNRRQACTPIFWATNMVRSCIIMTAVRTPPLRFAIRARRRGVAKCLGKS